MPLRRLERLAGALGMVLGTAALLVARTFPAGGDLMNDPAAWPTWVAGAAVALSAVLLVRPTGGDRPVSFAGVERGLLLLVSAAAYLWAMPRAGYFSASILWLLGVAWLAGERRWSATIATSVLLTVAGYLLFWKVMVIALPSGVVDEWLGLGWLHY